MNWDIPDARRIPSQNMNPKLISELCSMIESKFWSLKRDGQVKEWNLWLDANGIMRLKWEECGYDYFNPRKSQLIHMHNPAFRVCISERPLLVLTKEFAEKVFFLGFLPH